MFTIEKFTSLPEEVFFDIWAENQEYAVASFKLKKHSSSTDSDIFIEHGSEVFHLGTYVLNMMRSQQTHIIVKSSETGRVQTLMSGEVNSEGTFYSPYNLHKNDEAGSRAYLYKSQPENTTNLQAAFNAVGINNVRVLSVSETQSNHALATGWIEDTAPGETEKRTFRTPWGWD